MSQAAIGLHEVIRRTGLSRMQVRYLESRGVLGHVVRADGRTMYEHEQVELLERIARLRASGASIDEATALAAELAGGAPKVPSLRVDELIVRALADVERRSRVAGDLSALRARRSGPRP